MTANNPIGHTGPTGEDRIDEMMALLRPVVEVSPRLFPFRQRRPVISLEATDPQSVSEAVQVAEEALRQHRGIPYARLEADQLSTAEAMLDAATLGWSAPNGPALRFPTYTALRAVLNMQLPEGDADRRRAAIRRQLLKSHAEDVGSESFAAVLGVTGTLLSFGGSRLTGFFADWLFWVGFILLCALLALFIWRALRLFRMQWLLWRNGQHRWVSDHLAHLHPETRSKQPPADKADSERLANQLLVTAVLRDLWWSYWRLRRIWKWPIAYPVLLVSPPVVPTSGGAAAEDSGPLVTLLREHVATRRSPLVMVIAGTPPSAARELPGGGDVKPVARWRELLGTGPRKLPGDPVWRVGLSSMPAPVRRDWLRAREWWEWGFLWWLASVLTIAAGMVIPAALATPSGCGGDQQSVQEVSTELIGYRLCGEPIADLPGDTLQPHAVQRLRTYQRLIFDENLRVDHLPAIETTRRQVLTLVAVSVLTTTPGDKDSSVMAEAEGLAGVYAAQYAINHTPGDGPFLKVAVANAGGRSAHVDKLMARLKPLLSQPSVLGAVVTVNSTIAVKSALDGIKDLPVTLVSPTMTADYIGKDRARFYQMITPNMQQATLVVDYVRRVYPGRRLVDVYPQPSSDDLYVSSLKIDLDTQARAKVKRVGFFQDVKWDGSASLSAHCDSNEVLFYGGRYTDFGKFVNQLRFDCGSQLPPLIADDSTARLLSDSKLASQVSPKVPVALVTKSLVLSCRQLEVPSFVQAKPIPDAVPPRVRFRDDIRSVLQRCMPNEPTSTNPTSVDDAAALAGGWAAASYDATRVLHWAIGQSMGPNKNPIMVADDAAKLLNNGTLPFGVTGPIAFKERVAADGRISLYCIQDLQAAFQTGDPAGAAVEVMREGNGYPADRVPKATACGPA